LTIDTNDEPISYEEAFKHVHWQWLRRYLLLKTIRLGYLPFYLKKIFHGWSV